MSFPPTFKTVSSEVPITVSRNLLVGDSINTLVNAGATDLTITILTEAVSGIQAGAVQRFFTSSTGKFLFAGIAVTGTVPTQAANTGFELRYRGGDIWVYESASGSQVTIINDPTFATATSSNVPSAESVKAYVDANGGGGSTQNLSQAAAETGIDASLGNIFNIEKLASNTEIPKPKKLTKGKEYTIVLTGGNTAYDVVLFNTFAFTLDEYQKIELTFLYDGLDLIYQGTVESNDSPYRQDLIDIASPKVFLKNIEFAYRPPLYVAFAASINFDHKEAYQILTYTGNFTLAAPTNRPKPPAVGFNLQYGFMRRGIYKLIAGAGAGVLTLSASYKPAGGTTPVLSTTVGKVHIAEWYDDGTDIVINILPAA